MLLLLGSLPDGGRVLAQEQMQEQSPNACVQRTIDALEPLWQTQHEAVGDLNLFTHPCTGGLYLVDAPAPNDALHVLWQGWWLLDACSLQWQDGNLDREPGPTIMLIGRFLTGIGPTGHEPFVARVRATYDGAGWQILEPQTNLTQDLQADCDTEHPLGSAFSDRETHQ